MSGLPVETNRDCDIGLSAPPLSVLLIYVAGYLNRTVSADCTGIYTLTHTQQKDDQAVQRYNRRLQSCCVYRTLLTITVNARNKEKERLGSVILTCASQRSSDLPMTLDGSDGDTSLAATGSSSFHQTVICCQTCSLRVR
ncbi:hypothetical protein PAMP_009798 [Pampus punctatissimus]